MQAVSDSKKLEPVKVEDVVMIDDFPIDGEVYRVVKSDERFAFVWGHSYKNDDRLPQHNISDGENGIRWCDNFQDALEIMKDSVEAHGYSIKELNSQSKIQLMRKDLQSKSEQQFKENYRDHVLDEIDQMNKEEEMYKLNYMQEILSMLNWDEKEEEAKEINQEIKDPEQEKKEREKRVQAMKRFEETHTFEEVYRLKKEVLQELKQLNLTEQQMEKLLKIEKALDAEKQAYDRSQNQDKNEKKGLVNRIRAGITKRTKSHEMER